MQPYGYTTVFAWWFDTCFSAAVGTLERVDVTDRELWRVMMKQTDWLLEEKEKNNLS